MSKASPPRPSTPSPRTRGGTFYGIIKIVERLPLEDLREVIEDAWEEDTSSTPNQWSSHNPARGQCVPTSLVVQDYLGGDIARVRVKGEGLDLNETHYYNVLENDVPVDLTFSQYHVPVALTHEPKDLAAEGFMSMRDYLVSNANTNARYERLRSKVIDELAKRAKLLVE